MFSAIRLSLGFKRVARLAIFKQIYRKISGKLEDTKGVIKSRKSKDGQYNDQRKKDKQRSTKHYTEN